jgi:uncharacterized protein (TIGR02145 family)
MEYCSNGTLKTYETVTIGEQMWMAENLNYAAEGSKCYNNDPANCATYGRLYDWATAMALPSSCNSTFCASQINAKHRGVCPSGWHMPSNAEWDALFRFAGDTNGTPSIYNSPTPTANRYLKATSGWNSGGNGEDTYGFAALPGGYGDYNGRFGHVGYYGCWWSASEGRSDYAYYRSMLYNDEGSNCWGHNDKRHLFSVRCAQDVRQ